MTQKIDQIVNRIAKLFNPEKIILFGSYANGTASADSDVDLLVVLPVVGSKREKRIEIRTALSGMGISKDIFVATPEELKIYWALLFIQR